MPRRRSTAASWPRWLPDDARCEQSIAEITTDQVRRFADTARLPASPLWPIVTETADRTVAAWEALAEKKRAARFHAWRHRRSDSCGRGNHPRKSDATRITSTPFPRRSVEAFFDVRSSSDWHSSARRAGANGRRLILVRLQVAAHQRPRRRLCPLASLRPNTCGDHAGR